MKEQKELYMSDTLKEKPTQNILIKCLSSMRVKNFNASFCICTGGINTVHHQGYSEFLGNIVADIKKKTIFILY